MDGGIQLLLSATMIQVQQIGPVKIFFGKHASYPYCNTLLVKGQQSMLVDPACEEKALRALQAGERIDFLFNTHYHPDHIRYNALFNGIEMGAHREDAPCFRSLDSMAEWVGVKGTVYEKNWKTSMVRTFGFRERESVKEVEDGTTMSLGGVTIQFLHFPGHTPGLTGFLIPEFQILFLADMELSPAGPWYHNRRADIQSIIQSVEKIRKIPAEVHIPSHGNKVFRGDIGPRLDRYLENIYSREEKILESLTVPRTLDQLTSLSLISGFRFSRKQVWFLFERNMIEKHLVRLMGQGKISRRGNRYEREV
jgi:glyoxylase-like metal-dependent hydrolase (beta-lactamase superfamily II)